MFLQNQQPGTVNIAQLLNTVNVHQIQHSSSSAQSLNTVNVHQIQHSSSSAQSLNTVNVHQIQHSSSSSGRNVSDINHNCIDSL